VVQIRHHFHRCEVEAKRLRFDFPLNRCPSYADESLKYLAQMRARESGASYRVIGGKRDSREKEAHTVRGEKFACIYQPASSLPGHRRCIQAQHAHIPASPRISVFLSRAARCVLLACPFRADGTKNSRENAAVSRHAEKLVEHFVTPNRRLDGRLISLSEFCGTFTYDLNYVNVIYPFLISFSPTF